MPQFKVGDQVAVLGTITSTDSEDPQRPDEVRYEVRCGNDDRRDWYRAEDIIAAPPSYPAPIPAPECETDEARIERVRGIIDASRQRVREAGFGNSEDQLTALSILAIEAIDVEMEPLVRFTLPGAELALDATALINAISANAVAYGFLLGRHGAI